MNKEIVYLSHHIADTIYKVLKINLTSDSHEIIKIGEDINEKKGISPKISEWMYNFAELGFVYSEDLEIYLKYTDVDYLKKYFSDGNDSFAVSYRRNIENEFHWVSMRIIKAEDFTLDNLSLLLYIRVDDEIERNLRLNDLREERKFKFEKIIFKMMHDVVNLGIWRIQFNEQGEEISRHYTSEMLDLIGFKEDDADIPDNFEKWLERVHPDDRDKFDICFRLPLADETNQQFFNLEYRFLTKEKGYRWFKTYAEVKRRENGTISFYTGLLVDINDRKAIERMNESIQRQYNILRAMAESYLTMAVIDISNDDVIGTQISSCNWVDNVLQRINVNESVQTKVNMVVKNNVVHDDLERCLEFCNLSDLGERLQGKKIISAEFVAVHVGWIRLSFFPVSYDDDNNLELVVMTTQVIDDEKRYEENLVRISRTDTLTRVYNRNAYESDLIHHREKAKDDEVAVLLVDLNNLKKVNDSLGHAAGDEMIKGVADCLIMTLGIHGNIYRYGGDEFIAILHIGKDKMDYLLAKLLQDVADWQGALVERMSISYGYAIKEKGSSQRIDEIIKIADEKMYECKNKYHNR